MTPLHHNLLAASVCVAMATLLWRDIESIGRLAVVMLVGVPATVGWMIVVGLFTYSPAMAFDFPPQAYSVDASMAAALGAASVLVDVQLRRQGCNIGEQIVDPGPCPLHRLLDHHHCHALHGDDDCRARLDSMAGGRPNCAPSRRSSSFGPSRIRRGARTVMTSLILFVAAASPSATIRGYSRIPFAAARDGDFFSVFSKVHPTKHFPHVSLVVITL